MNLNSKRGFVPKDEMEFRGDQLEKLKNGAEELFYLLNRDYKIKSASTFIGNHYMFSERQRLALARTISSTKDIQLRKRKQVMEAKKSKEVYIDGFNTIITLETALSGSLLLECMDETIRDMAGLRGTYRLIDKTVLAVELILKYLDKNMIQRAIIYLDAPVSNSGRLKQLIIKQSEEYKVDITVEVINEVDRILEKLPFVITSDAIILNRCTSWINMNRDIIKNEIEGHWKIKLYDFHE
ncbi:DUF434 domain-containing protein [Anaerosacchariphilus polymeriproducens]|uniref:DUF434 domain-containing protein n=1 Tax=Anaerosacchariphilus polymeriproducens TaxID=1812858 RepID=A0A371AQW7_9FIRM|nr:DUF434 domain-containing protein [Anaerosacchariphilus polymeriproducens]RDU21971.1 DUF434 domain-containing protein [Anaerosacchariphilus polymeriproducens]